MNYILYLILWALCVHSVIAQPPIFNWTQAPKGTPSTHWPDGPILGNGNIGVVTGGQDGNVAMYMSTNTFWQISNVTSGPGVGAAHNTTYAPCGLAIGGLNVSATQTNGRASAWAAHQDTTAAQVNVSVAAGSAAFALSSVVSPGVAFVLPGVVVAALTNTGTVDLDMAVRTWSNGNQLNVPIEVGCADVSSLLRIPCTPVSAMTAPYITKEANAAGVWSPMPSTGLIVTRILGAHVDTITNGSFTVPYKDKSGKVFSTVTHFSEMNFSLAAGASCFLISAVLTSADTGVSGTDPLVYALKRLQLVNSAAAVQQEIDNTTVWWSEWWATSSVRLDTREARANNYYYGAMYALGAATRAGAAAPPGLWSPWVTTDQPAWQDWPTMDYNEQAVYYSLPTANRLSAMQPYWDLMSAQVASGTAGNESASLGCPRGYHTSTDIAPFGYMRGTQGVANDQGMVSNSALAALIHIDYWYLTRDIAWLRSTGFDWVRGVGAFWTCWLNKTTVPQNEWPSGYQYWDWNDCSNEKCYNQYTVAQRLNPSWALGFIKAVFVALPDMASALDLPIDPLWADIATNLAPFPTLKIANGQDVISWYGGVLEIHTNSVPVNIMGVFPSQIIYMSIANQTLVAAANASLFADESWTQSNGFTHIFSVGARLGLDGRYLLDQFYSALDHYEAPNGVAAGGGMCLDGLGATQYIHDALIQSHEGFIRLFLAWPRDRDASFSALRARGGFLLSANTNGTTQAVVGVSLTSELGSVCRIVNPWPSAAQADVCVCDTTREAKRLYSSAGSCTSACGSGDVITPSWGPIPGTNTIQLISFPTTAQHVYQIVLALSSGMYR